MVQIQGTRTELHLTDAAWCRKRSTWAFACPDGVTRCLTFPNWKWNVWHWPGGNDPFRKHIDSSWKFAQLFARHYNVEAVFADHLEFDIDLYHRRPGYWAANDNFRPSIFERLDRDVLSEAAGR